MVHWILLASVCSFLLGFMFGHREGRRVTLLRIARERRERLEAIRARADLRRKIKNIRNKKRR